MILVDSSVWADHFRRGEPLLEKLIEQRLAFTHPLVIGELAMGHLKPRERVLSDLSLLGQIPMVRHEELLMFVDAHKLYGSGLGLIDAHLLASCVVFAGALLWTRDRRLLERARALHLALEMN